MSERILKPWPFTPAPQLVADIGGTNTRVALADAGVVRQGSIRRYANAGHGSLDEILRDFLAATATTECAGACVAVAGPVRAGVATMTNLDWEVSLEALAGVVGTPRVALLNDLQAQGHALEALEDKHLRSLLPGRPDGSGGTRLVVGAGTGFNAVPVHHTPAGIFVPASESGHIHLPCHGEAEQALARHLAQHHGIATVEEALCARGLEALHHWVSGETLGAAALTRAIAEGAPGARETGALYARLLGRTLASLALVHLPHGGIYLIGSVARAMAPQLGALGFEAAFFEMGRFSGLMEAFPVTVVEDDYAALLGCALHLNRLAG